MSNLWAIALIIIGPWGFGMEFYVIFKLILSIDSWGIADDDKSTLVQVMAGSSSKLLPETMSTQICVAIWRH